MNVIYRKSDGIVVGLQRPHQGLDTEYRNAAFAGGVGDVTNYDHVEVAAIPPKSRPIKVAAGIVEYESTEDVRKTERRARMVELLTIARSDWTAAQQRGLLQIAAQELTR